ncbi:TPA: hypothetical protein ACUNL2_001396 [Legionella pneumophila]|uniref:hypothetical protein n=1 Tax=Legionella pneumophila TaxID=446 RepID=UPI000B307CE1|nr:hypothetical protein [Legionella pneumophila]HAU0829377.1 hypothetical protein [Legionella pneumophila]HBD7058793.1 hypothetical protein [Legionella pneumophila]HCQ3574127.1 hypothetical protein [Legionella pneumophila]HEM7041286.1 hypothetical protein [Legionella pneumophila]HEO1426232.1 hypothetical protein [Legionella pneumophila]
MGRESNPGSYKLAHEFPEKLILTEASKKLFTEGTAGQGYVGILDTTTGQVHLIPAFNKDDGKLRLNKDGKPFSTFVESIQPLGRNTGDVHGQAVIKLQLVDKGGINGKLMGFGLWKDENNNIADFRTRSSSQNFFSVKYSEIYRTYFSQRHQEHSSHNMQLLRELPLGVSQKIFDCVSENLGFESESVTNSPRVNSDIRQHLIAEAEFFGDQFIDLHYVNQDTDPNYIAYVMGFEYMYLLIINNKIDALKDFIKFAPFLLTDRTREGRDIDAIEWAESPLSFAIKEKKYEIAKMIIKEGANWQHDDVINHKIIGLLKAQIENDPENLQEAQSLLTIITEENKRQVSRLLETSLGKEIIAFAKKYNKLDYFNSLQLDSGEYCVEEIIKFLTSELFKLEFTKGTNLFGYKFFQSFVGSRYTISAQAKVELEQILEKIDSIGYEMATDTFKKTDEYRKMLNDFCCADELASSKINRPK